MPGTVSGAPSRSWMSAVRARTTIGVPPTPAATFRPPPPAFPRAPCPEGPAVPAVLTGRLPVPAAAGRVARSPPVHRRQDRFHTAPHRACTSPGWSRPGPCGPPCPGCCLTGEYHIRGRPSTFQVNLSAARGLTGRCRRAATPASPRSCGPPWPRFRPKTGQRAVAWTDHSRAGMQGQWCGKRVTARAAEWPGRVGSGMRRSLICCLDISSRHTRTSSSSKSRLRDGLCAVHNHISALFTDSHTDRIQIAGWDLGDDRTVNDA